MAARQPYRHHSSGRARVTLNGRDVFLERYVTTAFHMSYGCARRPPLRRSCTRECHRQSSLPPMAKVERVRHGVSFSPDVAARTPWGARAPWRARWAVILPSARALGCPAPTHSVRTGADSPAMCEVRVGLLQVIAAGAWDAIAERD